MGTETVSDAQPGHRALAAVLSRSGRWTLLLAALSVSVALLGRLIGATSLSAFIPGWPATTPATGFAVLMTIAAVGLLDRARRRAGLLLLAVTFAGVLAAMLLPVARTLPGGPVPAYAGSVLLLLMGAIALVQLPDGRQAAAARLLALASTTLVLVAAIGISFRLLLSMPALVDVSLPTLLALLLLNYAVAVVRPSPWLIQTLTSSSAGAVMTRRLLPAVLLLPLIISWLALAAEGAGLLDSAFGSVLESILTVCALGALMLWGARRLDRIDRRRGEAERQALAQREWLHVTITSCAEAVVATDPAGIVQLVNPAAEALSGRSSAELVGRPIDRVFPLAADESGIEHPLLAALRDSHFARADTDREVKLLLSGAERYVEMTVAPINGADATLLGGVMTVRDVSLRRQNEQALRHAYAELDRRVVERTAALERANAALHESLALLRGVAESTPDLIVVKDLGGRVIMANPAQVRAIGKTEAEIVGHTDREFLADSELAARVIDNDRRVMSSGRIERVEDTLHTPEGPRTFLSAKSPLRDAKGNVTGVIGVATDISERKHIENELRDAQRFTQGLVETAPIVLYLFDYQQYRIVYASGMGLQALGYVATDLLAMDRQALDALVHPDDLPMLVEHLRRGPFEEGSMREVEFRCRTRAGEWRWMHGRERPFEPGPNNRLLLGVTVDITERKIAEIEREQLVATEQRLRLEAERANRAKDEFLAIVSHELRSPLNALRGWGFLLGSAKAPDASLIERATQAIKRNVDHQARLIDDLLDTSRVMSGKLNIERRLLNFVEVVQAAIEVVRPAAVAKRISMELATPTPAVPLEGDSARLQQIAVNLLSNAVKFTPEGGEVTVGVETAGAIARLSVTDTGAGIDPEFLPRVFERFTQADTSTTRRHGGLGIGLALVRHLTELHSGKVGAHSDGVGKGSTFTVELPLPQADMHAGAVQTAEPDSGNHGGLQGVRICALDDDPDARDVINLTLRQAGAEVRSVATGAELIAMLDTELPTSRPDVLLLDLAMPDEDGFTVLTRVRALESRKAMSAEQSIPAIAVTAFTEVSRARVIERGFSDHVSKPIDPAKLVQSILHATRAETCDAPAER